jgi:protein subunit release factor A
MKKYWKLILAGILLLMAGTVYGYKQYAYYKERAAIVDGQQEIQNMLEKETEVIGAERDTLLKEKFESEKRRVVLETERRYLNEKVCNLEKRLANITIPSDPSELTDFWKSRGFYPLLRSK